MIPTVIAVLPPVIRDAHDALSSDFYVVANQRDKWILCKFTLEFRNRQIADPDKWLRFLPPFVLPDVRRAVKNVDAINRKMERDLNAPVVREYVGRSRVSHRKAR